MPTISTVVESTPLLEAHALQSEGVCAVRVPSKSHGADLSYAVIRHILGYLLINDGKDDGVAIQLQKSKAECLVEEKKGSVCSDDGEEKEVTHYQISLKGFRSINKLWTEVFDNGFFAPFVLAVHYHNLTALHHDFRLSGNTRQLIKQMPLKLFGGELDKKKLNDVFLPSIGELQRSFEDLQGVNSNDWVSKLTKVGSPLLQVILQSVRTDGAISDSYRNGILAFEDLIKLKRRNEMGSVLFFSSLAGFGAAFYLVLHFDSRYFSTLPILISIAFLVISLLSFLWSIQLVGALHVDCLNSQSIRDWFKEYHSWRLVPSAQKMLGQWVGSDASQLLTTEVFAKSNALFSVKTEWKDRLKKASADSDESGLSTAVAAASGDSEDRTPSAAPAAAF